MASTVSEALEQIEKDEFDLLLCDFNIDRASDGYDVVSAMQRVNPRCATIVLTAYPGLESAVEGIHLEIDDYLIKPSRADELVTLLANKLASQQPTARILSVSYDEVLLATRHLLLEHEGYQVISAMGLAAALEKCKEGGFDLFSRPFDRSLAKMQDGRSIPCCVPSADHFSSLRRRRATRRRCGIPHRSRPRVTLETDRADCSGVQASSAAKQLATRSE